MNFVIITHVKHIKESQKYFGYAPYIREMNLWLKNVDKVTVVAPLVHSDKRPIDIAYKHDHLSFRKIPEIEFTSLIKSLKSIIKLPIIFYAIFKACQKTDHIHLRCPGNIGLIGCLVQILFPKKMKTAKYAGNWDPNSKQPLSYRFQKKIVSSTFLTKNMQVLVYGSWKNQSKNVKTFFTASYAENEINTILRKDFDEVFNFIFVGSLVSGKRPLLGVKIVEELNKRQIKAKIDIFGDGILKPTLLEYVKNNKLSSIVKLHGNVSKEKLKEAYKSSHFLLLPSKSEGWPKAVAEAMFFGTVVFATEVSCVSWMLDEGRRGVLIDENLNSSVKKIVNSINNDNLLSMSIASQKWSQNYTLDKFEMEIIKLLKLK